jgi:DNA-binding CsgD family transcriptional regulator
VAAAVGDVASRNDLAWLHGTALRCQGLAESDARALAADRLSNPQIGERLFISRRTVQARLVHVFAKLGISSRAQLAAQVARRPEAG